MKLAIIGYGKMGLLIEQLAPEYGFTSVVAIDIGDDFAKAAGADVHGTFDTLYTSGFPTVSITSPADQSFVTSPVTVAATASDVSGISNVEFYVDWNLSATATSDPYNFTLSGLTPGAHTVAAVAYSNAGIRNCYAVTLNH